MGSRRLSQRGRGRVASTTTRAVGLVARASTAPGQLGPLLEPPENPVTLAKANLGKTLFWEEQPYSTRTVSRDTCHIPEAGGVDPRALERLSLAPDGKVVYRSVDSISATSAHEACTLRLRAA